jgi:hypothetical protein
MTRFLHPRRWTESPAGAVFVFLVSVMLAPDDVQAGCSHLVVSRDQARLNSILQDGMIGLTDVTAAAPSLPRSPSPCRGAWCDQSPIEPVAPPRSTRIRDDSCACCFAVSDPDLSCISRLPEKASGLRPSRREMAIFRPPRPLVCA